LAVRQHVMVYGITMTVEGDDTGYGSQIGLGVVDGNEASCHMKHQLALSRATHKHKWVISFNKYTPAFSTSAVWIMCLLCYVCYPPLNNYLFTDPAGQVQLMRRGSSKAKDSLRCEPHLQKPKQGRVQALWSVLMRSELLNWHKDFIEKKNSVVFQKWAIVLSPYYRLIRVQIRIYMV